MYQNRHLLYADLASFVEVVVLVEVGGGSFGPNRF
jgi:hypothetical protein